MKDVAEGPGQHILVIEDEEDTASLLAFALEQGGFHVTQALTEQAAAGLITNMNPPAAVILDLLLPDGHGLNLLTLMRRQQSWMRTPVIVVTASHEEQDISTAMAKGATAYVAKPLSPIGLLTRVRKMVEPKETARHDKAES